MPRLRISPVCVIGLIKRLEVYKNIGNSTEIFFFLTESTETVKTQIIAIIKILVI